MANDETPETSKDVEAAFFAGAPDDPAAPSEQPAEPPSTDVQETSGSGPQAPAGPPAAEHNDATQQMAPAPGPDGPSVPDAGNGSNGSNGAVASSGDETMPYPAGGVGSPSDDGDDIAVDSFDEPPATQPAAPRASALPFAPPLDGAREPLSPEETARWQGRIEALLSEARAQEGSPTAAPLWFEAGRLYENELKNLREAAAHYQQAHTTDPTFVPVIHAARRLFAQLGKWGMVVVLIDEELKLEGAPAAALLVEKGRIHETKLGKADRAIELYREALQRLPGYPPAVDALMRHLSAKGDHGALAEVLDAAAKGATDDRARLSYVRELAQHYESRMNDAARALACYEAARALAPRDPSVLSALNRLYTRAGNEDALAEVLEAEASLATGAAEVVRLLMERARILESRSDQDGALAALQAARRRAPSDTLILSELSRLYEAREAWPELADVYLSLVDATQDKSERVAIHAEAGELAETKLQDRDRAIAHYRACILTDPSYQPAISALGRLFARNQLWHELNEVFEIQLRAASDDGQKVPLLFKQAELLADRLEAIDGAIEKLLAVLEINPGYVPALKLVSSLYLRQGRWEDLIKMYEAELDDQEDKDQAIFLLEKIGSICESQLDDTERAIGAYQRMLEWVSGYLPALRSLGRLYAKTERWEDLIQINTEESQIVGDQNHVVSLMTRNGDIWAERMGDTERAIDSYRRALTLMPNFLPALKSLGRIYAKAGRWEDLIKMHRQEAEVARQPETRASLLFEIAHIYADQLDDSEKAAKTYRELLEERPGYHPAIRALASIAEATGDWDALVGVYEKEIHVIVDPRDKALLRVRMAELLERRLNRKEDAVQALKAAVEEASGLLVAHERLIATLYRLGDAKGEAKAREAMQDVLPDPGSQAANLRALASLYQHALGDPERAQTSLKKLLVIRPDDRDALRSAMTCALSMKDYASVIQHAEVLASVETDPDEVAQLHLQIASWKEGHLDPPQDALANYLKALEYAPQDPVALRAVEKVYVERECWEGLVQLYTQERKGLDDEPVRMADLSMKLGELAERRMGNPEQAAVEYEEALRAQPTHMPAIVRLKELYGSSGSGEQKLRMLALEAQASKDPARAIQTLLEVGDLQRDQFGNIDASIDSYFQVLARDPMHQQAFETLESMLVTNGRFERLVDLYRRRAAAHPDPTQRVEMLMRAGHILVERLSAPDKAREIYEHVLASQPQNVQALRALGDIHFAASNWEGAIGAYGTLVQLTQDAATLGPVYFRLGVIFTEHRPDAEKAVQALTACLSAAPAHEQAQQRLAVAYAQSGDAEKAVALHQQLLASAQSPQEMVAARLAMADLYENALGDVAKAAGSMQAALDSVTDPSQRRDLLTRVAALWERAGQLDGYLTVADQLAEALAVDEPRRAAEVLARCAKLVHEHKGQLDRSIELSKRGLELAPDYADLRGFLADRYTEAPNQRVRAVEEHRRILAGGRVRVESIKALYRLWAADRAHDKAFVASELLTFLRAASEDEELFFGENRSRVGRDSEESLSLAELTGWVVHPDQRNVAHDVLSTVATELGKVNPHDLGVYQVDKRNILNKRSDDPVRQLANVLAQNLGGLTAFDVYRTAAKPHAVAAHNAQTVALVVGMDITRNHPTREQRFLLGRKIMALRCGHHLVSGMDAEQLAGFLSAIGRAVDKSFKGLVDRPDLDTLAKRISSALSRGTKKALGPVIQQLADEGPGLDLDAFLGAMSRTEARAGLLLCGDTASAFQLVSRDGGGSLAVESTALIHAIERDPVLADMAAFSLSDEFFTARQDLLIAINA